MLGVSESERAGRVRAKKGLSWAASLGAVFAMLVASCVPGYGEGPRWETGLPYFTTAGNAIVWYTTSPQYFTDPGDLSASVNHAAADALVAAAAATWNVPTTMMTLSQGGELAEHVSSANVYLGANGPVFPSDVSSANYAAIQIAVIYDSDGSVTNLLLGSGASDPSGCQQTGVTESVDSMISTGLIRHALLILNGRCTGPDPDEQLQMQYQVERAIGRILGVGWSQTNDNVFTGTPQPTNNQVVNWPIMHPIDVVCGTYTYQCLPSPFTLRPDDVGSISVLYPIASGAAPAGKIASLTHASNLASDLEFPTGQGIQGMNVVLRRHMFATNYVDGPVVSAVTGLRYRWNFGNVVTGTQTTMAASFGGNYSPYQGYFSMNWVPIMSGQTIDDAWFSTEAINPLYTGPYTVGPYQGGQMGLPGPSYAFTYNGVYAGSYTYTARTVPTAPAVCSAAPAGTAAAPLAVVASGWWTGQICGTATAAWPMLQVAANRSFTMEVTALDGSGNATTAEMRPLMGVWKTTDSTTALPTIAASTVPFNSMVLGLTSLSASVTTAGSLRLAITDERGNSRPDYNFQARILYANSIAPTTVSASGGVVTISGMGFRTGNAVTLNGVGVTVLGWTSTSIVAVAPSFASLGSGSNVAVDVGVSDLTTGGTTVMSGALHYPASAAPGNAPTIVPVSPMVYVAGGQTVSLVEQMSLSSGGAVSPGEAVSWQVGSGPLLLADGTAAGGPGPVTTTSDSNGLATMDVTVGPLAGGAQGVGQACAWTSVCSGFTAVGVDPSLWTPAVVVGGSQSVPGTGSSSGTLLPVSLQVTDGSGHPVVGAPVTVYQTVTAYETCPAKGECPVAPVYGTSSTALVSDGDGLVVVTPEQLGGTAETTKIAVSTGTQGFLTLTLQKTP